VGVDGLGFSFSRIASTVGPSVSSSTI
jgi:hypothetical protein